MPQTHEDPWVTRGLRVSTTAVRGSDRRRSGDLSIFSRTLYQLSYRAILASIAYRELGDSALARATLTGLEPATSAVTGRRANQLRHRALLLCAVWHEEKLYQTFSTSEKPA